MISETLSRDTALDDLLNRNFPGKVVRKDLTKLVKEAANVPVYVLEYLLGSYCASDDPVVIEEGLRTVKKILAENYVRPDEAEKVKSTIRERGSLRVIDKVTVTLNEKRDVYEALLSNLGVNRIEVPSSIVKNFEKLLVGGIWCIATLEYFYETDQKGSPFLLRDLKPIQMPNMDLEELFEGRRGFSEAQWIDVILRSTGMEPTNLQERVKWHLLARIIPLVENNYNLAELGPRGTGRVIFTRRSAQIVSWSRVGRRRSPTYSTTWRGDRLVSSAFGTLSPSTRSPGSRSRTKTASRL